MSTGLFGLTASRRCLLVKVERLWTPGPEPMIHRPLGIIFTYSATFSRISVSEAARVRSRRENLFPIAAKCTCESLNPGSTRWPLASIVRVFGPFKALTVLLVPTAMILPSRAAMAWTRGLPVSIVRTLPFIRMRSAACAKADIEIKGIQMKADSRFTYARIRPGHRLWCKGP